MVDITYRNRRAVRIENDRIRVTVLVEGGHIAEILHRAAGVNPLWTPPWPSIEPSRYDPSKHPEYGGNAESRLLAGIMGHNLCLDLFGGPSLEEAAAGVTVHGEASVLPWTIEASGPEMNCVCEMPMSRMRFTRELRLHGSEVRIAESVESRSPWDRPVAWTQHVTLGPPFLERGKTRFEMTATKSRTYEGDFGDLFNSGVEFEWPLAPLKGGGQYDLRTYSDRKTSAGYTGHLMDPSLDEVQWTAANLGVTFGYKWRRAEFPWCGLWEENHSRQSPPWNGETMTRGMEFGVSPQPETRRAMITRGQQFGVPAYRWLPAGGKLTASYAAFFG